MYRRGVVSAVDPDTHRVRVKFPAKGDVESAWLDVPVDDALDDQLYSLPSLGAQVACMLDERDEEGCVLGAIYSKTDPPSGPKNVDVRRWQFKDGAVVEYDRDAKKLTIVIPSGGELDITVGGKAVITTTGDVEIKPTGLCKIAGAAAWVARADKTEARLQDLESHANSHGHGTGVGPSTPAIVPLFPGPAVASTKTKTD